MHAVYLACLVGGTFATAVFTLLGAVGGAGHGHVGHAHGGAGHGHVGQVHGGAGQAHAGHASASSIHAHHGASNQSGARSVVTTAAEATHVHTSHAGGDGHIGGGWFQNSLAWTLSWLSPLALAAGAVLFGAAGLLAEGTQAIGLVIAIVSGFLGVALVRLLMNAFVRASVEPLSLQAEGAIGQINAPIREGGTGEVVYTLEGLQRSAAARSFDGRPIPRGAAVVILRRERGIALVEPLDPLEDLSVNREDRSPALSSPDTVDLGLE